jgi:hypothetical protein
MAASGTRLSRDLRGLGIPDTRFGYDGIYSSDSSYTQAGPRPGTAVPSSASSELVVHASGEQDADLTVTMSHTGSPTLDTGGRYLWRLTSETSIANRGWTPPNGWHSNHLAVQYSTGTTYTPKGACTIPSSQKVVCLYYNGTSNYVKVYDPSTNTLGSAVAIAAGAWAAITCVPGTERLIAVVASSGVATWYSDDEGATWTQAARNVFATSVTGTVQRARLHAVGSDLALMIWSDSGGTDYVYEYASNNGGASFVQKQAWTGTAACADMAVLPSGKCLWAVKYTSGSLVYSYTTAGAWYGPTSASAVAVDASETVDDDVAVYVDHDGAAYIFARDDDMIYAWVSYDEGATWSEQTHGLASSGWASAYITGLYPTPCAGACAIVHGMTSTHATSGNSVGLWFVGGWGNVGPQEASAGNLDVKRIGFGVHASVTHCSTYLPIELPSAITHWTDASGGVFTETLNNSGYLALTTTVGTIDYTRSTSTATDGIMLIDVSVQSGGAVGSNDVMAQIIGTDGANGYGLTLRLTATQIRLLDRYGAAIATVSLDLTARHQFILLLDGSRGEAYYRAMATPTTAWTAITDGTTLTSGGAVAAGSITWGHSASATASSRWYGVGYVMSTYSDTVWGASDSASSSYRAIIGKTITPRAYPIDRISAAGATFLRGVGGPGYATETHAIATAYDYGIERLFYDISPSPEEQWRTTGTSETIIGFRPTDSSVDTQIGKSYAIVLLNANFATAYWERWDGAAWQTVGTYNGSIGFSGLTSTIGGTAEVRPNSATAAAGRYIWRNEFRGGTVVSNGGYRIIERNTEGVFAPTSSSAAKQAAIYYDTTGGALTQGTASIIAPNGVLFVHNVTTAEDRYRLRIPSQTTATSDFRLGLLLVCEIVPFARQWGRGWTHERAPNADAEADARGTIRKRKRGPPLDRWSFSWAESIAGDLTKIRTTNDLDYVSAKANYSPLANDNDVPYLLWGLLDELESGQTPVVALNSIPDAASADTTTVTDPTRFLYGTINSSVSLQHVVGDENESEVYRVATIEVARIV